MTTKAIVKTLIGIFIIGGGVTYFLVQAMQSSWAYYYSVDELMVNTASAQNNALRVAGRVKPDSIQRDLEKMQLTFTLAGATKEVSIQYLGSVPDNFAEGKEVVVEGRLGTSGVFQADTLTTKCESKYKAKVD